MNTEEFVRSLQGVRFHAVVAEDAWTLQDELDAAVNVVRKQAGQNDRRGILVTRRSRSLFTVELTTAVPYGMTMERDRWHRSGSEASGR